MAELSQWIEETVQSEKKLHGTADLQAMQGSLSMGEGKAIRDLLSNSAVGRLALTEAYLGRLSDVLTASLPVAPPFSAQPLEGAMELSVEAHVALMHHFRVNALPDPLADMDDPDVAIAHAEMALEVALRTGVVDLMHASQLMLQMHLVLSVTKDIETLTVLKELSASGIHRVSLAIDYLGMLNDALNAQHPFPRLPSAQTVKGMGGLTPAAVSALRHHLHVESQTATPVGLAPTPGPSPSP